MTRRRSIELLLHTASAALLCLATQAPAQAQPQAQIQPHRVSSTPTLKPLAFSTVSRVLTTPAAAPSGFPAADYAAQWPGVSFNTRFAGTSIFFRIGPNHAIFHLLLDGQPLPPLVAPQPGPYTLDALTPGPHTLTLFLATESQAAPNTFGGFALPAGAKPLPPPAPLPRQIEFIGDSHTVGYGNLSPKRQCTQDEIWATTDNTSAFGPATAAHFHADYQVNAISGRGIVRNYDGMPADTLPQAYPYTLLDHKQTFANPAWKPQLVVIALGTNDFSTPLNPGERWTSRDQLHADYEATYRSFLQQLRARYPSAYFIVWATDAAHGEVEAESQKVVQQLAAQGEKRISFLPIDHLAFSACDSHPSLSDEATIAARLEHLIDASKVWLQP